MESLQKIVQTAKYSLHNSASGVQVEFTFSRFGNVNALNCQSLNTKSVLKRNSYFDNKVFKGSKISKWIFIFIPYSQICFFVKEKG